MRRILLTVAYDGTEYHGWQLQENGNTVEAELNNAIKRLTGEELEVIGASRTDAGVHALCNRAVFDTDSSIPDKRFYAALNSYLPNDIRVISSKQVDDNWHPRKCKTHKTYEYRIMCGDVENPLTSRFAWHIRGGLNVENMQRAAKSFIGEHDFTSFCSVKGTALSNIREIIDCQIIIDKSPFFSINGGKEIFAYGGKLIEGGLVLRITGTGFLYNMVRIIAGTLVGVGMGRIDKNNILNIIAAKDRTYAGQTAPPRGLTLVNIEDV